MTEHFAYEGREGQTRTEPVHVPAPTDDATGGKRGMVAVLLHRVVNVATDPGLGERALSGTLHVLDDGQALALPFVYHDPSRHIFVLVVPQVLAHRIFHERADLLRRIGDDHAHPVPPYVADAEVVVSLEALRLRVSGDHAKGVGAVRAREAEAREELLADRESRLRARAEAVTAREDELRLEGERLEAARREVALREQELDTRFESLRERERDMLEEVHALSDDAAELGEFADEITSGDLPGELTDDLVQEVRDLDAEPTMAQSERPAPLVESVELVDDAEPDIVEPDDGLEQAPFGLVDPRDVSEAPDGLHEEDVEELAAELLEDVEELVEGEELDDSDVLEIAEVDTTGVHRSEQPPVMDGPLSGAATPPPELFEDRQIQMLARMADGPWLFARLEEGHEESFRKRAELLVQYVAVEDYPVVLLALVDWGDDRPYVRRAAFDPRKAGDRAMLDLLRTDLRLKVALFGPSGSYERTLELHVPERELNLAMALEHADRAEGTGDGITSMERALAAPPPVRLRGHPFVVAADAETASEALEAVAALSKWSTPVKMELALLGLSLPRQLVDDSFRRVLDDAIRHGVAISERLIARAVSLGVVAEPGELVLRVADSFRGTAALPERGGLSEDAVARNWERLLALADAYEVALDSDTHEAAWKDINAAKGETGPAVVEEAELKTLPPPRLSELLEHPKMRLPAALELLSRTDAKLVPLVLRATRKMPREEVLEVVPRVVAFGEEGADALIDALAARKTFVRQAAALALGELKLRRAISPLVQLLRDEPTEVWHEVGRVLALFGSAAIRTLARAMREPKGAGERFSYTIAHMTRLEVGKLDQLHDDSHDSVRKLAAGARTHRQLVDDHAAIVQGSRKDPDDGVHGFSRRFYEVVAAVRG